MIILIILLIVPTALIPTFATADNEKNNRNITIVWCFNAKHEQACGNTQLSAAQGLYLKKLLRKQESPRAEMLR
jgi:hypothetical protein